jgi:hypothetical protein
MQGMPNVLAQLPDDIDALKALVAEQLARNATLEQEKGRLNAKVLSLQEQLNLALARRYAASSEKISPDQVHLFNEAEARWTRLLIPIPMRTPSPSRPTPARSGAASPCRTPCPGWR